MSENLKIWESVESADSNYVKPIVGKTYKGSSANPTYMVKRMTEAHGPIGVGWGFRVAERWEREIADPRNGEIHRTDVYVSVMVWLAEGDATTTWTQFGSAKYIYVSSQGNLIVDEEAWKKATTDALTKCLSLVGCCAEIYLDDFDPNRKPEPEPDKPWPRIWRAWEAKAASLGWDPKSERDRLTRALQEGGVKEIANQVPLALEIVAAFDLKPEQDFATGEAPEGVTDEQGYVDEPPNTGDREIQAEREKHDAAQTTGKEENHVNALKLAHALVIQDLGCKSDEAHDYLKAALPAEWRAPELGLKELKTFRNAKALAARVHRLVTHDGVDATCDCS